MQHAYMYGGPNHGVYLPVNMATFAFANQSPINFTDPTGQAPSRGLSGNVSDIVKRLNEMGVTTSDGKVIRNVGTLKGTEAHKALLAAGRLRNNDNLFNTPRDHSPVKRYVYSRTDKEWIDMLHFIRHAGEGAKYAGLPALEKVGGIFADKVRGYSEEIIQGIGGLFGKQGLKDSAFSSEDLPSDQRGFDFGAWGFDIKSDLTLGEQLGNYMRNDLKVVAPQSAPDWDKIAD